MYKKYNVTTDYYVTIIEIMRKRLFNLPSNPITFKSYI